MKATAEGTPRQQQEPSSLSLVILFCMDVGVFWESLYLKCTCSLSQSMSRKPPKCFGASRSSQSRSPRWMVGASCQLLIHPQPDNLWSDHHQCYNLVTNQFIFHLQMPQSGVYYITIPIRNVSCGMMYGNTKRWRSVRALLFLQDAAVCNFRIDMMTCFSNFNE